jgi:RNA polymerase sigma-70 factor (ECF subfamily)
MRLRNVEVGARSHAPEPSRRLILERELDAIRPWLARYVAARIGDSHEAEDVVQEVLLATAEAARSSAIDVTAFALGVARHKTADWWRATSRRRSITTATVPDSSDPAPGPAETAEAAETVAYVRSLLQVLSDREADLLLLRMSGCSAQEAGSALGMSSGAVRIAQHRALGKLRAEVGRRGDGACR